MTVQFQCYAPERIDECLRLFDDNCPAYFAVEERQEYLNFLRSNPRHYFVGIYNSDVACAFGYGAPIDEAPSLNWIMVDPKRHRCGLGQQMMGQYIAYLRAHNKEYGSIATSQHAEAFFQRHGAQRTAYVEHGWGAGMHRIDMTLPVNCRG